MADIRTVCVCVCCRVGQERGRRSSYRMLLHIYTYIHMYIHIYQVHTMHIHSNTHRHARSHSHTQQRQPHKPWLSLPLSLSPSPLPCCLTYLRLYCSWKHQSKDYLDQPLLPAVMNRHSACPTLPLRLRNKVQTRNREREQFTIAHFLSVTLLATYGHTYVRRSREDTYTDTAHLVFHCMHVHT